MAEAGAQLDVSGAAGFIQIAGARGATSSLWWWTDAGTVSADVSRFAWGGSLAATGGRYIGSDGAAQADSRANGGTFKLGGGAISLRQDMTDVSAALSAFRQGAGAAPSSLFVAADQLAQFDNVYLYAASALGGAARIFTDLPGIIYGSKFVAPAYGSLTITGPLDWNVTNRLELAAGTITASAPVNAKLSASYVMLTGGGGSTGAGSSTLTVKGQTIDVEGAAFSRFSQVNLISSGDIRLSTPKIVNGIPASSSSTTPQERSTFTGSMASAGDFLLSAQRIYPVSAVNFTIQTPGNVTFAAPAGSNTRIPLSAGGGITVIREEYRSGRQSVRAAGQDHARQHRSRRLGDQDGESHPRARQPDLGDSGGHGRPLWRHCRRHRLVLQRQPGSAGAAALEGHRAGRKQRDTGRRFDHRPARRRRPAGDGVDPGQGRIARHARRRRRRGRRSMRCCRPGAIRSSAFDIHFTAPRSADGGKTVTAGDAYPMAGTQITISGGNGIPAGTYTLYPAHYATLPGAMRVVYYGSNVGRNVPIGNYVCPTARCWSAATIRNRPCPESSRPARACLRCRPTRSGSNTASTASTAPTAISPRRQRSRISPCRGCPSMRGGLRCSALQSIVLNGIALTQPGQDSSGNFGRGGELDISAPKIAVVGHAGYVNGDIPAGYVGLDITQLNGFESILIGGSRSDTKTGTLITPNTDTVLVDTRGETFSAPEILLVAQAAKPGELQTIPQTVTANGQTIAVEDKIFAPGPDSGTVTDRGRQRHQDHRHGPRRCWPQLLLRRSPPDHGTTSTAQDIAALLGGTLDASGTVITGADISKFNYVAPECRRQRRDQSRR